MRVRLFSYTTPGAVRPRGKRRVNPPRFIVLAFATVILSGTGLLMLPAAHAGGRPLHWINALFLATSATCVTGLTVVDIGASLTHFGQFVVLALIQIGGLGIMTLSCAFVLLLGKRLSFREQIIVKESIAKCRIASLRSLIGSIAITTLCVELLGAVILTVHLQRTRGYLPFRAFYFGLFHSVSAFCNAGFSLYSDNLERFSRDPVVAATIGALVVVGGLGFVAIHNLLHYRFWLANRVERGALSLQTKTVLITSAALIAFMAASFLALEWNGSLAGYPLKYKLLNSCFHAVTPRTAGFNTLPMRTMGPAVLFITIVMMFIGASPGSTGGGIKTCTLAILIAASRAIVRGREEVRYMKRSVEPRTVAEAVCVTFFAACLVIAVCTLLMVIERGLITVTPEKGHLLHMLFETVSAFGTVGLSTGITPLLTTGGKLLIILTMFAGRVGPLTLALIISRRQAPPAIHYPEEQIMIG